MNGIHSALWRTPDGMDPPSTSAPTSSSRQIENTLGAPVAARSESKSVGPCDSWDWERPEMPSATW